MFKDLTSSMLFQCHIGVRITVASPKTLLTPYSLPRKVHRQACLASRLLWMKFLEHHLMRQLPRPKKARNSSLQLASRSTLVRLLREYLFTRAYWRNSTSYYLVTLVRPRVTAPRSLLAGELLWERRYSTRHKSGKYRNGEIWVPNMSVFCYITGCLVKIATIESVSFLKTMDFL